MHTFTSPTHPTKSHHITHTTQHQGPKAPKNLNRGSIIQTPPTDIDDTAGPWGCLKLKTYLGKIFLSVLSL